MSDTRRDIERDRWIDAHIGMCGTCTYRKKWCECETSERYGEDVEDDCACGEYIPKKGVMV